MMRNEEQPYIYKISSDKKYVEFYKNGKLIGNFSGANHSDLVSSFQVYFQSNKIIIVYFTGKIYINNADTPFGFGCHVQNFRNKEEMYNAIPNARYWK